MTEISLSIHVFSRCYIILRSLPFLATVRCRLLVLPAYVAPYINAKVTTSAMRYQCGPYVRYIH